MVKNISNAFRKVLINHPLISLLVLLGVGIFFSFHAQNFQLDASADALVLENDPDLAYFRESSKRYTSTPFVFITYSHNNGLFTDEALQSIKSLRDELAALERVQSVTSMLDVPLLRSPPVPLGDLANNIRTLEMADTDRDLARIELTSSPIYKNLIISPEGETTAIQVSLKPETRYRELLEQRNDLKQKQRETTLSSEEKLKLKQVIELIQQQKTISAALLHQDIQQIRIIIGKYRSNATLHLGGVPMIADDMMSFVKNDLSTFGIGVLVFLILTLSIIFRQLRWVIIPMICCSYSAIIMVGLLGLLDWRATVVSSNFVSLMLILTMSITMHLIVRFKEVSSEQFEAGKAENLITTVREIFAPCLYTALTTIVAFSSLIISGIVPIVNFGWMMSIGVGISFIVSFTLFPILIILLGKKNEKKTEFKSSRFTAFIGHYTAHHPGLIYSLAGLLILFTSVGLTRLEVENSFISYFDKDTEIYQGMKLIDDKLGGTTPLDVIIKIDSAENIDTQKNLSDSIANGSELSKDMSLEDGLVEDKLTEDDFFSDDFETDDFETRTGEADSTPGKYWFTREKMDTARKVHQYLDSLPETGKVLSIDTMMQVAEEFNEGKPLDTLALTLLYSKIPEDFHPILINPYISFDQDEMRFTIRVRESEADLRRNQLLNKIHNDLTSKLGFEESQVYLTNMLVMYNNMLQSLFRSQILTIAVVMFGIMMMFMLLFRSVKLAIIGIIPNALSAASVLAIMGWLNISLDMMTITIAAIVIGIGVDDTIHYIHRFGKEIKLDYDYQAAISRSHETIGNAMYYTSLVIMIGFSILVLSNFVPTIYFGLLTGLAMFVALISNLTLLPLLISLIKPFGSSAKSA